MFNVYFRVRVFTFAFAVDELEDRNDVKCCVCFFFRLWRASNGFIAVLPPSIVNVKALFFPFSQGKG